MNPSTRSVAAMATIVAFGIALAGYFIGKGPSNFRSANRTATVKGLADREVVADFVIWTLNLRRAGADVTTTQNDIKRDRDVVIDFLLKQGLTEAEIERVPITTQDKQASQYALDTTRRNEGAGSFRYVASAAIIVRSAKVDNVRNALGAMDTLTQAGVLLAGARDDGRGNVVYRYTKFNELRLELIADATKNARASAEKFAADSSKKVGAIRSAQQGLIQIFGEEGQDEANGYTVTSYRKKVRVVNTIEFDLID
jgi:uncharacterized protein